MLSVYIKSVVLKAVRYLLSFIFLVKDKKIMFQSYPDYSDNARAFSDFVLHHTNLKVIWAVSKPSSFPKIEGIEFIASDKEDKLKDKLIYLYHTVTSKYLISTHSAFLFANKRKQIYVCCWHGMPLKRIAQWQSSRNRDYLNNTSYILSTSRYYIPLLAKCFGKQEDEILPSGYPRNDWLFQDSRVLEKLEIVLNKDDKLIMYLPTFRKPQGGGYRDSDKDSFKDGPIDFTSKEELYQLNEFLKKKRIILVVKPHPAEANQLGFYRLSNVFIIPHHVFVDNDIQLNQVLHYTDALITDFSGAFVDFLNLDRPIGFVLTDIDQYKENRGFVFDNPLDYMPGMKIVNKSDFETFCNNISSGIDEYKENRKEISYIYNDYCDNRNCQRLADYLNIKTDTCKK